MDGRMGERAKTKVSEIPVATRRRLVRLQLPELAVRAPGCWKRQFLSQLIKTSLRLRGVPRTTGFSIRTATLDRSPTLMTPLRYIFPRRCIGRAKYFVNSRVPRHRRNTSEADKTIKPRELNWATPPVREMHFLPLHVRRL